MKTELTDCTEMKVDKYTYIVSSNFREGNAPTITELTMRMIKKQVNRRVERK